MSSNAFNEHGELFNEMTLSDESSVSNLRVRTWLTAATGEDVSGSLAAIGIADVGSIAATGVDDTGAGVWC